MEEGATDRLALQNLVTLSPVIQGESELGNCGSSAIFSKDSEPKTISTREEDNVNFYPANVCRICNWVPELGSAFGLMGNSRLFYFPYFSYLGRTMGAGS